MATKNKTTISNFIFVYVCVGSKLQRDLFEYLYVYNLFGKYQLINKLDHEILKRNLNCLCFQIKLLISKLGYSVYESL